jgi:hypothetical protein
VVQLCGMTWWYRRVTLQLLDSNWREWWTQVGRPAGVVLLWLVPCVLAINSRVMRWSWSETVAGAVLLSVLVTTIAWWQDSREANTSLAILPALLSESKR